MSLGTLYANFRARSLTPKAIVKYYNLDVAVVEPNEDYKKNFRLGKVPAFIGPKGYKLIEIIAISLYCMYN